MDKAKSFDEYVSLLELEYKQSLQQLRETIQLRAPEAVEVMSYGMPAFKYKGKILVYYAAFKNHLSLFPASASLLDNLKGEWQSLRTSKGTLQFTPGNPLSEELLHHIIERRMVQIDLASHKITRNPVVKKAKP